MGRGVDRQVAVIGVLARDLLQVLPGVAKGSYERAVWHIPLAACSHGFVFDLVAFRVEVGFLPGSLADLWLLAAANDDDPHAGGVRYHDDDHDREQDGEHPIYRRIHQDLTRVIDARGAQCGHGVVQLAVSVTAASHARGNAVTQAYLSLPIFMRMVVPTVRATAARSWFAMPKSGKSWLIPPNGSFTPAQRK